MGKLSRTNILFARVYMEQTYVIACLTSQLAYITYVRGSMSTLQIFLFPYFYSVWSPTLSREEPFFSQFGFNSRSMCSCSLSNKLEPGGIGTGYGKNASHSALITEQQIKKEEKGSQKERIYSIMFLRTIWVCCLERTEYGEVKTTDQNHRIVLQTEP